MAEETRSKNGANAVIINEKKELLVVQHNYRECKWALPGGGIHKKETARRAAAREVWEETGLFINPAELKITARLRQWNGGLLFLFEADGFSRELMTEPTDEILEARFMSLAEISHRQAEFGLGYTRMIIHYLRCVNGICPRPHVGTLSEAVENFVQPFSTSEYVLTYK